MCVRCPLPLFFFDHSIYLTPSSNWGMEMFRTILLGKNVHFGEETFTMTVKKLEPVEIRWKMKKLTINLMPILKYPGL